MTKDRNKGRLLANRYHLIELVGQGAMGQVYRAEDTLLGGLTVAVKFISQSLLNEKRRNRFEQEAKICALLSEKSIHIVQVRDYGVDENDVPFYTMEFLQGKGLHQLIQQGTISLKQFLRLTRQVSLGLQSAHKGITFQGAICPIIHRDIKPSNIFITQDVTLGELVKILDFGVAKLVQADHEQTHSFQGTLAYCSPEQMEGKELDPRSDIYSLGITMYEMLSREMPIVAENNSFGAWYQAHRFYPPEPFRSELQIPSSLQDLIFQCLAKEQEQRPQNIDQLLQKLSEIEGQINTTHVPQASQREKPMAAMDTNPTEPSSESAQFFYQNAIWPSDKPRQKIVFPKLIPSSQGPIPSLWVMLDQQDLSNHLSSTRFSHFLFIMSPHPMVYWITALHNASHSIRWLPYYLDLKTNHGQWIARYLAELGYYEILFFGLEYTDYCQHVLTATISKTQCQNLSDWLESARNVALKGTPETSKQLLRQQFEKLKPKIETKLASLGIDAPSNISGL